ncbi:helix-turn-helix transcriptional regulator [Blastochloris tepida]|uniref:Helix-turn-helix domain-containing protein n=1 Tax=Blastochloris tepida TaxID=2233851 RepID=A0A348G1J1_9HYPH|nr:helix-turn-helix domain-containing protein [Blastochloris tepida]BBF93424.1 hypothetical protein BLTE_21090 [Blastochloris tepida]
MESDNDNHFLNVVAAAKYLGLGKSTLDKWRCTGGGPRFSKLGARVVYAKPDLDQWVAANRRASTSAAA